jgi:hypothetical protein
MPGSPKVPGHHQRVIRALEGVHVCDRARATLAIGCSKKRFYLLVASETQVISPLKAAQARACVRDHRLLDTCGRPTKELVHRCAVNAAAYRSSRKGVSRRGGRQHQFRCETPGFDSNRREILNHRLFLANCAEAMVAPVGIGAHATWRRVTSLSGLRPHSCESRPNGLRETIFDATQRLGE